MNRGIWWRLEAAPEGGFWLVKLAELVLAKPCELVRLIVRMFFSWLLFLVLYMLLDRYWLIERFSEALRFVRSCRAGCRS